MSSSYGVSIVHIYAHMGTNGAHFHTLYSPYAAFYLIVSSVNGSESRCFPKLITEHQKKIYPILENKNISEIMWIGWIRLRGFKCSNRNCSMEIFLRIKVAERRTDSWFFNISGANTKQKNDKQVRLGKVEITSFSCCGMTFCFYDFHDVAFSFLITSLSCFILENIFM